MMAKNHPERHGKNKNIGSFFNNAILPASCINQSRPIAGIIGSKYKNSKRVLTAIHGNL
ncbi:MAG: hypothetical protein ACOX4R_08265 [Lentihominibacter sp.]